MNDKLIIIVHVNEKCKDLSDIFFRLLNKNWIDCPYRIVVSYKNNIFKDYGFETYISISESGLANDVYEIMKEYEADYCISLLGDAFLSKSIDTKKMQAILDELMERHIDYCRLYHSNNKVNSLTEINLKEIYGVSFIAFFSSRNFACIELKGKTDFQFEKKYLDISRGKAGENLPFLFFSLPNDVFGIIHGVVKGLWLRDSYKKIKAIVDIDNTEIRGKMSICNYLVFKMKVYLRNHIPVKYIHSFFSKF